MDRIVMMIDVNSNKLAEPPRSTQFAETGDETSGGTRKTDDRAVHVYHKCMRAVYLRSGRKADI